MSARRWRLASTTAIAVILAAGLAACGNAAAPGAGGTSSTPATSPPSATSPSQPSTPRASAADQLAGFFAAADTVDARLKHAAALVNGGIGKTSMKFSPEALAAVRALSTAEVARAIPAGLPTELLRRTLLAYSDLESRALSFRRVDESQYYETPFPIGSQQAKDVLLCLKNGAQAAARYDADLAAVRTLALATDPIAVVAPDSRAAAELALRIHAINGRNSGCEECGGWIATTLSHIVWQPEDQEYIGHSDGYIDGIRFRATYHAGSGWDVMTWAC